MRLIAKFAKDIGNSFEIVTVFDTKTQKETIDKNASTASSIAHQYPSALWYERKIFDDFGIVFANSFDTRPLLHHERFPQDIHPLQKNFTAKTIEFTNFKPYKYKTVGGDGVFEVAVGPIHAGIIEPGHFQFSQDGERMLHLDIRHFYTHRGIEKMVQNKSLLDARAIVGRISGNESVAYQTAYMDIISQASKTTLPVEIKSYHALLLEFERLIHHVSDIGFIPNDAGFSAALSFASKLAEDSRRIFKQLTGHRFGFDAVSFKIPNFDHQEFLNFLDELHKEIKWFEKWIKGVPSLWDRFDTTGILTHTKAVKYDSVGVMARASGVALDRRDNDFYKQHGFKTMLQTSGDVAARFLLRIMEIYNSIEMMKSLLQDIKPLYVEVPEKFNNGSYQTFVESSIGELFMSVDVNGGLIDRFFVRDPSHVNWQVVHAMMLKDIIADFPLINKSCDLSYAGNDL